MLKYNIILMKHDKSTPKVTSNNLSARKNRIKYLIQAAFWIVIVLIGFEISLRYFVSGLTPEISFDPVWGKLPVAGSVIMERTEGDGITHFFANGEVATPYQGGANIPVLGDSNTRALQVNDNQSYVSVAETMLRGKGIKVDLHNLGASGGTLADYTYWAPFVQSKYQPSIVVIQISTGDFWGTGSGGYVMSNQGNYFIKNSDGTLKVIHKPLLENYDLLRRIRGEFALLGYGSDRLTLFLQIYKNSQVSDVADETQPSSNSSSLAQKLDDYRAQLMALHTAFQGQRVIILGLPYYPLISGDQIALGDNDYSLLLDQARRYGDWQVLDPLSAFQALWLQDHKLPRGFTNTVPGVGHLNADGHALVGQLLADKIEEMLR
jgi:lysophospholipase L1-like esterase